MTIRNRIRADREWPRLIQLMCSSLAHECQSLMQGLSHCPCIRLGDRVGRVDCHWAAVLPFEATLVRQVPGIKPQVGADAVGAGKATECHRIEALARETGIPHRI